MKRLNSSGLSAGKGTMTSKSDQKPHQQSRRRTTLIILLVSLATGLFTSTEGLGETFDAGKILETAKAKYASLHSYTDQGAVVTFYKSPTSATGSSEKIVFDTAYVTPRQFLFVSKKLSNGERLAVWANGGDFNRWWSSTRTAEDYPKGQGAMAFANSSYPTSGAVTLTASLLFAGSGLQSSLSEFSVPKAAGMETIAGHPCFKIAGQVGLAYGTGNVTGGHKATLWIDKDSLLVRKLFEDTPPDSGGFVTTTTTTFDPQSNPKVDPARFNFKVPSN